MENDNAVIVIGIFLGICLAVLLIVKIVEFFTEFNDVVRYLTGEMRRAGDDDEYRYWRRELRCHYLCLIPFVNERNVMRVYKKVFYKPKHNSPVKRTDGIFLVLAPSVIGIAVCALCLCGASWAWFTSTTSAGTNTIKSAIFQISEVEITKENETAEVFIGDDGKYTSTLDANETYTLSFKAAADNTSSKGYCCITVYKGNETAGTNYYTNNIGNNDSYTIMVENNESEITVKIEPIWGDVAKKVTESESLKIIASGGSITVVTADSSGSNGLSNPNVLTERNSETTEQTTPAQKTHDTVSEDKATTTTETTSVETEEQKETTSVTTEETTGTEAANEATESDENTTKTLGTGEVNETDQ